jgi:isocitrate/isopropylmalate dehydrogenase
MNVAIIAGDGIGKDVTAEAVRVLDTAGRVFGRPLTLEHLPGTRCCAISSTRSSSAPSATRG